MTSSKQAWIVGQTVKVGFMKLRVARLLPRGEAIVHGEHQLYHFVPYSGLTAVSQEQARSMVEGAKLYEAACNAAETTRAAKAADTLAFVATL